MSAYLEQVGTLRQPISDYHYLSGHKRRRRKKDRSMELGEKLCDRLLLKSLKTTMINHLLSPSTKKEDKERVRKKILLLSETTNSPSSPTTIATFKQSASKLNGKQQFPMIMLVMIIVYFFIAITILLPTTLPIIYFIEAHPNPSHSVALVAPPLLSDLDLDWTPPVNPYQNYPEQERTLRQISMHSICEPVSQANDLYLKCPSEDQFIVIYEGYYSDTYADRVCNLLDTDRYVNLTGTQLISMFKQSLYSDDSLTMSLDDQQTTMSSGAGATTAANNNIAWISQAGKSTKLRRPTILKRPNCFSDLHSSFNDRCSGRNRCHFNVTQDHVLPGCVAGHPGHVYARHLCIDDSLLTRYCLNDEPNDVKSSSMDNGKSPLFDLNENSRWRNKITRDVIDEFVLPSDSDFGFIQSPGYPNYYATSLGGKKGALTCSWPIEARAGQLITVKVLDVSVAPHEAIVSKQTSLREDDSQPTEEDTLKEISRLIKDKQTTPIKMLVNMPASKQPSRTTNNGQQQQEQMVDLSEVEIFNKISNNQEEDEFKKLQRLKVSIKAKCDDYDQILISDSIQQRDYMSTNYNRVGDFKHEARSSHSENIRQLARQQHRQRMYQRIMERIGNSSWQDFAINNQFDEDLISYLSLTWTSEGQVNLCLPDQSLRPSRLSFTSTDNFLNVKLISSTSINVNKRGVLLFYHKHGCPSMKYPPKRSHLFYRNYTTEIYECFKNHVFNDTRTKYKLRHCIDDYRWDNSMTAPCVLYDDLLVSGNSKESGTTDNNNMGGFSVMTDPSLEELNINQNNPLQSGASMMSNDSPWFGMLSRVRAANGRPQTNSNKNGQQQSQEQVDNNAEFNLAPINIPAVEVVRNSLTMKQQTNFDDINEDYKSDSANDKLSNPTTLNGIEQQQAHKLTWHEFYTINWDKRLLAPTLFILILLIMGNFLIYFIVKRAHNSLRLRRRKRHYQSDYSVSVGMTL